MKKDDFKDKRLIYKIRNTLNTLHIFQLAIVFFFTVIFIVIVKLSIVTLGVACITCIIQVV